MGKYKKPGKFILTAILLIFLAGCDENQHCKRIETGPVNIIIYPNSTEYQQLNVPGGWLYLTAYPPSKGILVYRYSNYEFRAYERTCPYDPEDPNAIILADSSGLFAYDTVCGSRFLLTDGYPIDGPAQCPLTQFYTSYDGNKLRIYY
jgi:nitrite reductase/ring-hydroxylating ferredoxin subunit